MTEAPQVSGQRLRLAVQMFIRLALWVLCLAALGGAIGFLLDGAHLGVLLLIGGAEAGVVCFCVHAVVLALLRRKRRVA